MPDPILPVRACLPLALACLLCLICAEARAEADVPSIEIKNGTDKTLKIFFFCKKCDSWANVGTAAEPQTWFAVPPGKTVQRSLPHLGRYRLTVITAAKETAHLNWYEFRDKKGRTATITREELKKNMMQIDPITKKQVEKTVSMYVWRMTGNLREIEVED